jgi:RNA polymerase sigma-70 factor (ECF subfamily)
MQKPGASEKEASSTHRYGMFPATVWTVVLAVREDPAARTRALETLCRRYWSPVYAWIRRNGRSQEDAEDLTQAFFLKVLTRQTIERVERERGRFRSYLLMVLKSFLMDEWDRSRAQRRNGGRQAFSLDVESEEAREALAMPGGVSPERAFDRRWALEVLEQARLRLGEECEVAGKGETFRALFAPSEGVDETQIVTAQRLGITANALKMTARRMRRRLEELIRAEVSQTVSSKEELEEEIRYLMEALSDAP